MRVARHCLIALVLAPCWLINAGCNNEGPGSQTGPTGDTSKAYKSSDEAAKDMMKNQAIPKKP